MTLREDALWVKQNWPYDQRKHWVLDVVAVHMGFRWLNYGVIRVEEYGEILRAIRQMPTVQRDVLKYLLRRGVYGISVEFPDGRVLEVRQEIGFTFIRDPGREEWQETALRGLWDLIDWIEAAQLVMHRPGEWIVKEAEEVQV